MKRKKEQWKPKITNILADGTAVEDISSVVIPAGHPYYRILKGIIEKEK